MKSLYLPGTLAVALSLGIAAMAAPAEAAGSSQSQQGAVTSHAGSQSSTHLGSRANVQAGHAAGQTSGGARAGGQMTVASAVADLRTRLAARVGMTFAQLDADKDGFVTENELTGQTGHLRARVRRAIDRDFRALDIDRDGKLSQQEWSQVTMASNSPATGQQQHAQAAGQSQTTTQKQ